MNNPIVVNRSLGLPRPVQHQIVSVSPAAPMVLEKLLDKIEQLERKVSTLQRVPQPNIVQPTKKWVSATLVEQSLPPAEPKPATVTPRRIKVRRSSLLDIFD